jgi:hypothetical protein
MSRYKITTRSVAAGAAVLAALALWAVSEELLGIDLWSPRMGSQPSRDIEAGVVAVTSAVASLAGWALLAILERFTARARTVWVTVAVIALVASLGAPLSGTGITTANRVVLMLLHLAVGAVLIPPLYRSSPAPAGHRVRSTPTVAIP